MSNELLREVKNGASVEDFLSKYIQVLLQNKDDSKNRSCIVLCYLSRFYFLKLTRSVNVKNKDLKKFEKLTMEWLGSHYDEWQNCASEYSSKFKVVNYYRNKLNSNRGFFTKSVRSYQRYMELSCIYLEGLRREGIKCFNNCSNDAGRSQGKTITFLSRLTRLSERHINDIINDNIQSAGNRSNTLYDILYERIDELYGLALAASCRQEILEHKQKLETLEVPRNSRLLLKYKQDYLVAIDRLLAK